MPEIDSGDEETELPFVVTYDIGTFPDGDIAVQITYATSHERFEGRQWDKVTYVLNRSKAIEFAKALLRETGVEPRDPAQNPPVRN